VLLSARWLVRAGDNPERRAGELGSRGNFQHGPDDETASQRPGPTSRPKTQLRLHTYGWVDRRAGIARIPIERAMDLLATRAAPARREARAMKRLATAMLGFGLAAVAAAQPAPLHYDQRIGERLPLAAALVDETGTARPLGYFFGARPVILLFGYYKCPQLCSVLERSTLDVLHELQPTVGAAILT